MTEQDIWEMERARRSSFVIDLRPVAKLKEEAQAEAIKIKKETTKLKKETATAVRVAKKGLAKEMRQELKSAKHKLHLDFLSSLHPEKATSAWFSFKFKKNSPWAKFIAREARILSAPVKIKKQRQLAAEKRANRAEEKVVWYRSLLSFVVILLIIIIPLKLLSSASLLNFKGLENKILGHSQLALNDLMAATSDISALKFTSASSQFEKAGESFLAAQEDLSSINDTVLSLAALSNDPKLKMAAESKRFLTAGAQAASLGQNLVLATNSLFNGDKNNFTLTLSNFISYGQAASSDAKDLKITLAQINPNNLPDVYRAKFDSLNKQAGLLADNLDNFVSAADKLKEVLGLSRDKRYLLVFQNNTELRASGGFLGSYALLDLSQGKIRNLEVPGGGSYDTEAGLKVLVTAPQPLWLVNPLWHFWDANWWPDWPTTAKNLMWFYAKSSGPSVDGVISVTPSVVEDLLEITGPISLPEYNLTVDANNFWSTVETIVEAKNLVKTNPGVVSNVPTTTKPIVSKLPLQQGLDVNVDNKPKKIIGDLMAKILEVLPQKLNQENLIKILALFQNNLASKQVLFYFNDPALETEVEARNWAGELHNTDHDYLLVVDTNIAGQKSDAKMEEKIDLTSQVAADGSIINTVKISRAHTGIKNEPMTGVRNVDWLRVYVPEGSELLSATGWRIPDAKYLMQKPDPRWEHDAFLANEDRALVDPTTGTKIYTEANKTVFANWLMVDPGETGVVTISYRLPFNFWTKPVTKTGWLEKINALLNPDTKTLYPYSLMLQKQPGTKNGDFSATLNLPSGEIFWRYPDDLSGTQGWQIKEALSGDKYWSILVQK